MKHRVDELDEHALDDAVALAFSLGLSGIGWHLSPQNEPPTGSGISHLTAAKRAFLKSKLGDEIELP